jgi:hypothetical protein
MFNKNSKLTKKEVSQSKALWNKLPKERPSTVDKTAAFIILGGNKKS